MTARCFVGTERAVGISAHDRGLAYGDGLFETMRAHRGSIPWWDAHWARLVRGAQRLHMAVPAQAQVLAEAQSLLAGGDGVLKLIVTRGPGGRGYAPSAEAMPTWVLSHHPSPAPPPATGLVLRWCEIRLAAQPMLAGIKHCNRLEQVLARAEWAGATGDERDAHEGLMRGADGEVVCATAANLFVLQDGRWRTPLLDRCGVAGVCRQWLLSALDVEQRVVSVEDVESAEAIFLCNAVRGILAVARVGARSWPLHDEVAGLQRRLAAAHPGFAPAAPSEMP